MHGIDNSSAPLYSDKLVEITPSWLSVGQTRYAIRTVVRLDNQESQPRVGIAYVFFFGAILLMAYSLYQFKNPELPVLIPWLMLLASFVIWVYSGWVAFSSKARYRLLVTLLNGHEVGIETAEKPTAAARLAALTQAMDWHRNEDILIDAERASHVRRRQASSSRGGAVYNESDDDLSTEAEHQQADKEGRHLNKLMPLLAAILKGRR